MKPLSPTDDEFLALLDAACDGQLSAEGHARLEAYLAEHPEAQRVFLNHLGLCRRIRSWRRSKRSCEAGFERLAAEFGMDAAGMGRSPLRPIDCLIAESDASEAVGDSAAAQRPPHRTLPALYTVPPALSHLTLFHSAVFSYLIAAVVVGGGLLAVWAWTPSPEHPPMPVVGNIVPKDKAADEEPGGPKMIIGRITRTTDCRWFRPDGAAAVGDAVTRGRRYRLVSGELEIAYNIGSKVTLYGPTIFDADGVNCGLLWTGKAVARAVPGSNDAMHGGRPPGFDPSGDRVPALFAIRTPYQVDRNTLRYNFFGALGDAEYTVVVDRTTVRGYVSKGQIATSWAASGSPDATPENGLPLIVTIDKDHTPGTVAGHQGHAGTNPSLHNELPDKEPHEQRRDITNPPHS